MRARAARGAGSVDGYELGGKGRDNMRVLHLIPAALLLLTSAPVFAQEPFDYVSKQDYFSINMPKEPKVEQTTYPDEYRLQPLPAR